MFTIRVFFLLRTGRIRSMPAFPVSPLTGLNRRGLPEKLLKLAIFRFGYTQ